MKSKNRECIVCGESVKPWFETCFGCHENEKQNSKDFGKFPDKIKAADFMKQMGIDHW